MESQPLVDRGQNRLNQHYRFFMSCFSDEGFFLLHSEFFLIPDIFVCFCVVLALVRKLDCSEVCS